MTGTTRPISPSLANPSHENDPPIERAIDEAPIGITIADARRSDEPLIYLNDAFERPTGYPKDETGGVNCRFL